MKKKLFAILAMIVMTACAFTGCTLSLNPNSNTPTVYTTPIDVSNTSTASEIVDAYVDAVVTVFVVNRRTGEEISFGSGVAVASGGYIATNHHVVSLLSESSSYALKVYHNNCTEGHNAEYLWSNVNLDCAIIKCECEDLPFVKMADRFINTTESTKLKALEQVIAIGTPVDFSLQNSATIGYISSQDGRVSYADGVVYENLIQHTAPINHGNSGGPLFDMQGNLIGLNTLGNDDANSLFFAVPIQPIMTVIDRVVAADKEDELWTTPVLGFSGVDRYQSEYSTIYFDGTGMYVSSITESGPAVGKLQVGDSIRAIKVGDTTYQIDKRNDLLFALLLANKGDTVELTVQKGIVQRTVSITLG